MQALPDPHRPARRRHAEVDRAAFANRAGADLCISLARRRRAHRRRAHGVATYYYGTEAHGVAVLGRRALRRPASSARSSPAPTWSTAASHAKTWDLLRRTRMPAVRLELGYLTNPGDAARLADPAFRDVVAEAVVVGRPAALPRRPSDPHTGVLRLARSAGGRRRLP